MKQGWEYKKLGRGNHIELQGRDTNNVGART